MADIDKYLPRTGRLIREDKSIVNEGDIMSRSALEIARGNYPGASPFASYGELTVSGAVTNHLIWPKSGSPDLTVPPKPGVQMSLSSTSGEDAVGGTGIQNVTIVYLDGDLNQQTEVVELTGISVKQTVATDIRYIQCAYGSLFGSGRKADGNISITYDAPAIVHSFIPEGQLRCASSARRVPAGKRLIINGMAASSMSGTAAAGTLIKLFTTSIHGNDYSEAAIPFPQMDIGVQDGSEAISNVYFPVEEGVIVGFEATTDKGATVNAAFFGWIEDAN